MRKLFSLMLIAVGLLISGQAKAVEWQEITSNADFKQAIDNAVVGTPIYLRLSTTLDYTSEMVINDGKDVTIDLNDNNIQPQNCSAFQIFEGKLTIQGSGAISGTPSNYKLIWLKGSTNPNAENYSVLTIGKDVSVNCPNGYAIMISQNIACAYGVVVNVNGHVDGMYGALYVNGSINKTTGNVPVFNIGEGAVISSPADGGAAIYAGGYAKWNITDGAEVVGPVGIYAKSGELNVTDAKIYVNATVEEGQYQVPTPDGNGFKGGNGSAIVLDSKNGYAGEMKLTVSGNSEITGAENAYALDELKTDATVSKTDAVVIESGNINGNINTTTEVKENVKMNGTITGGTFSDETIKEYINKVDGVIDVQAGEETKYIVNGMPEGKTWVPTIADAGATDYVKIADDETVASNKTIAYLNIPSANTVTVKNGAKLSVGEVVLGADAVIVVEAGARLIVNGTNGLIAFETTNLVLKAAAGQPTGMFVLNPDVKANKQPWATLEYVSQAFMLGTNSYMWEMFTNPFATILTASREPNQPSIFQHVVNGQFENFGAWGTDGDVRSAAPFELIAVTNTSDQTTNVKYTFTGQLQGSNDAAFSLNAGFNYLGNGYTALMNAKQVIAALQQSSENVRTLLYVWEFGKQGWNCYNGYKLNELNDVNPLTAFVLYADEAAEVNMDYEKLIWNVNK